MCTRDASSGKRNVRWPRPGHWERGGPRYGLGCGRLCDTIFRTGRLRPRVGSPGVAAVLSLPLSPSLHTLNPPEGRSCPEGRASPKVSLSFCLWGMGLAPRLGAPAPAPDQLYTPAKVSLSPSLSLSLSSLSSVSLSSSSSFLLRGMRSREVTLPPLSLFFFFFFFLLLSALSALRSPLSLSLPLSLSRPTS